MWWLGLLKSKWTWIALGLVALTTFGSIQVYNYGVKRYNEGVFAERAGWQKVINRAIAERDAARLELQTRTQVLEAAAAAARRARDSALAQVQSEIRNAENVEAQFAVYSAHRRQLRDQTAANHSDARADYLSSIGADPGVGTGGIRPFDLDPNVGGGCDLRTGARSLVGNCLG